jgi:phosphoribosyl-dephospho-CoA transferase
MLAQHPGLGDLPLVADWAAQGWPVIVRRPMPTDAAGAISAALPLPPCHGKRRVAFAFPADAEVTPQPAVLLREAAPSAPEAWQPVIAGLLDLGEPRVFGALLWQHLTGMTYLTERSDLDLLWTIGDHAAADALVQGLRRLDGAVRLDGELELPDGAAVNWREFAQGGDILVKSMAGIQARSVAALFAP